MRPLMRRRVSKGKSAKQFHRQVGRTRGANLTGIARGGIRL